jgi:hypothetical protein
MRCHPELTRVEQLSQQQSMYNQIGKLTVRLLLYVFDPRADRIPTGHISLPLTHF